MVVGAVPPYQSSLYEELLMAEVLEWNEDTNYVSESRNIYKEIYLQQPELCITCQNEEDSCFNIIILRMDLWRKLFLSHNRHSSHNFEGDPREKVGARIEPFPYQCQTYVY